MKAADREFLDRFVSGPRFLLLGQGSWALQDGADPLLAGLDQFGGGNAGLSGIRDWDSDFSRSALSRLSEHAGSSEVPPAMAVVAAHAWNGVYSTIIDARITRLFDADWRRVAPVVGLETEGRTPRSTTELKIRMLFGGLHLAEDQRPPTDELSFALREQEALSTLGRLTDELITPRGVLAIEGYRAQGDWLESKNLFGVLSRLQPGQAHLFSADRETLEDPFLGAAIDRGHLTPHEASLGASIAGVDTATGRAGDEGGTLRSIRIGESTVELPRDIWNSIVTVARPVDQTALQPLPPASAAVRYKQFRAFMGASEGVPDWHAIVSGFAFHREFEDELWNRISGDLEDSDLKEPLRLEGQTASGKSVALVAAAIRAAKEGQFAVLHVTTRSTRPQLAVIDRFAGWATEHGARATLLLWDGMADPDDYFTMHRELRSRGRRVVIVGTSYLTPSDRRRVVAPGRMSEAETAALSRWLADFGIDVAEADASFIAQHPAFLGVLYRLLPDSRRKLKDGLALELRTAESKMEQLSRDRRGQESEEISGMTAVGAALAAAGVSLPDFLPRSHDESAVADIDFADRSTAERLTSLVVVAGRRGLRIPLELALRVLGREGSESVVEVVKQFDIIRWSDDEVGDQFLGTRNALEAELLGQADLPDVRGEIAAIAELLRSIKPRPGAGGVEVEFAVDLLNRLRPDTAEGARFIPHYLDLVAALRDQRNMPGRTHPRLVLYEANFARKWVMWAQEHDEGDPGDRLQELTEASRLLDETLVDVTHPRTRLNLLVESASVLGAEAYEKSKVNAPASELRAMASTIVSRTSEARALDPENYYPIDVLAWVALRLVRGDFVSAEDQVDIAADALASMVSLEKAQLSRGQQAKYDSRFAQIAALLGDSELEHSRLEMLAENEDPSAYFLLALKQSGLLDGDFDRLGAVDALERLRDAPLHVREDWRCARLLLDVFWIKKTGVRFLQGEREALPFSTSDWEECLAIVDSAVGLADFDGYRAEFLRGLAYFHLGQVQQSKSVFDQLDRDSGSLTRRVFTTYLASNADGSPRVFSGQVRSVRPDGSRGFVWVDELGVELPFIPRRFNIEDLGRNDLLPDFWVGFNMRGPFGDPIRTSAGSVSRQ